MKRILSSILALVLVFSGSLVLANTNENTVDMEVILEEVGEFISLDKEISLGTVEFDLEVLDYYYIDGSLMVPVRELVEKLGGKVSWNNERRSVEITGVTPWTEIIIGENKYFFGKIAPFELSRAPELKDGLTYVPVEFFSQVLKFDYKIDDNILIFQEEGSKFEKVVLNAFIQDTDLERNRVLILGDGTSEKTNYAWLTEYEGSEIVNEKGEKLSLKDLKVGHRVIVTLPEVLALSYPAQGKLEKIVVLEDKSFEIDKEILKSEEKNSTIEYPVLKGEGKEELNKKIEEFVNTIEENGLYKDLDLHYEISLVDDNKISILFKGVFVPEGFKEEKYIVKSLNLDLESAEEINFYNYFKEDKESQEKLNEKLEEAAREYNLEGFEAEGIFIYFREGNLVVYYWPLDDAVEMPVELYIPIRELKNLINR